MVQYIDKNALVAEIEKLKKEEGWCQVGKDTADVYYARGFRFACERIKDALDTSEVKEVDLDLITGWFDHIAQIADDRMTLTKQKMTDVHALDEIKCLAKNSSEFITKY